MAGPEARAPEGDGERRRGTGREMERRETSGNGERRRETEGETGERRRATERDGGRHMGSEERPSETGGSHSARRARARARAARAGELSYFLLCGPPTHPSTRESKNAHPNRGYQRLVAGKAQASDAKAIPPEGVSRATDPETCIQATPRLWCQRYSLLAPRPSLLVSCPLLLAACSCLLLVVVLWCALCCVVCCVFRWARVRPGDC